MTPPPEILVVDDDRPLRSLLVTILRRQGFSVDAAANGLEAIELLNDRRFQLMLLDLMMPRMNGYEVLAHLKQFKPAQLPAIVVLSGAEVPHEAGAELVTQHLQKPFDVEALVETVRASLAKHVTETTGTFDALESGSQATVN